MAVTLGSNIAAQRATRFLDRASANLNATAERLASGLRINRASDDAAGLSIASSLRVNNRVYTQAIRNANDAISFLQIADGGLRQFTDILTRLKELATLSANGSYSLIQRRSIENESKALTEEYNRIAGSMQFNGQRVFDATSGAVSVQLGFGAAEALGIDKTSKIKRGQNIGSYAAATAGTAAGTVASGLLADVNNDGKQDLVSWSAVGTLSLSIGNGDGTFRAATAVANSGGPFSVAAGDVNGDGKVDLVVGYDLSSLQVLVGDGQGGFSQGALTSLSGGSGNFTAIKLADVNGDGRSDIIAQDGTFAAVLQSDSSGTLTQRFGATFANGIGDIATGDFNGDGRVALAITPASGSTGRIYSGFGGFSLAQTSTFASSASATIRAGDINHDGVDDLVQSGAGSVSALINNGVGSFTSSNIASGTSLSALVDINSDGILDVATSNGSYRFGRGDGTFQSAVASGVATSDELFADLNGDGAVDAITLPGASATFNINLANPSYTVNLSRVSLLTQSKARSALDSLDAIVTQVQQQSSVVGAALSRLSSGLAVLTSRTENFAAAQARIEDADVAVDQANYTRNKILSQTAASILAQASQQPALALQLLRT